MGQQILGRKQKICNDAWLEAMKQIEDLQKLPFRTWRMLSSRLFQNYRHYIYIHPKS